KRGKKQNHNQQVQVKAGELIGFQPQRFVRKHRAESFQHQIQAAKKKQRANGKQIHHDGEERIVNPAGKEQERAQTQIDYAQNGSGVDRASPDALLFLKSGELPQAIE